MTEKLFYSDSHMKEFDAVVISCEACEGKKAQKEYRVVLDRTAFFPEGGGQTADTGELDGIRVTDVREKEDIIYHMVETPLEPGRMVHGKLDWEERFSKMQQHSGEHILSGLVHERYGYDNVGFHLGAESVTLDFNGPITKEQMRETERLANEAVFKNLEIEVSYPTKEELKTLSYRSKIEIEGQVRLVTVPGYDICACCAPHTARTGEIGMIKIVAMQNYKGGVRVTIQCGVRALNDYNRKEAGVKAISNMLSAKEDQIVEAVQHLKEEIFRLAGENEKLAVQILAQKAEQIPEGRQFVCLFEDGLSGDRMREYVNQVLKRNIKTCMLFNGTEAEGYRYVAASRSEDVRPLAKELNAACCGRGGGKPDMVQGQVRGTKEQIRKCLAEAGIEIL